MSKRWLNLFLHFSGYIFSLKQKIVDAKSWTLALPYVFLLLLAELGFLLISWPLYLAVSPEKLQERGFVFPTKEKEPAHLQVYTVRRKISLTTILGAIVILVIKFIFVTLVSGYLLGAQSLLAATQDWNFSAPGDYAYDDAKIEVTGGTASLKDQLTSGVCSGTATACTALVTSPACIAQAGCAWSGSASGSSPVWSTTWGAYSDWEDVNNNVSGTSPKKGGNPTDYKDIVITRNNKAQTASGYWQQSFTTTAANPETAVISFDWSIKSYNSEYLTSYIIYVFVDNFSGAPTIGNQVWSQTITSTTPWVTVPNVNIASKLTVAGTYYIKLAARRIKIAGQPANIDNTVGWDNVALTWTKNNSCSGTPIACNTYVSSPTCTAQGGCSWATVPVYPSDNPSITPGASFSPTGVTSWNSFSETATKNGGEINYQLSSDEGVTWKYWDGLAWGVASTSLNANPASIINTKIASFPASAGKIKWQAFLVSNGSQQVILDNISIGYTQNALPSIQNLTVSQNISSGYVLIDYNLLDGDSDPISLVNYEYSITGAFSGEQMIMTPAVADPAHSGIISLSSSPAGLGHAFVWDARTDLGNIFSNTIYIRLRANDGIGDSDYQISPAVNVDYVSPVVSGVTAGQTPASANVQIGYDLSEDTPSNILVELQVSSDGGLNWTVPVVSVSGDVGATVTSGNGKSIVWHAGIDFANQEQDNMMVRIRAEDKYQNQGNYVGSSGFVLDNRAPIIATPADLLAQPLAGATTVLVGGSFVESNPDINNFYAALNDGSYGSAELGDADTATPADKSVSVGMTLKGNDYISDVKIEHTDDFGQLAMNENTLPNLSYKYVKPYTPLAPTISNAGGSSLDVTINKHPDEADGLAYAIWENTQSLYVQSDGSLGAGPYWQPAGIITVTGLVQPISQYSFTVKSRNTSDTSHAVSSESDFSSSASSDYQSPQIVLDSITQTTNGTKYVVINYTGTDYQNHANNLTKYEYSLNGADWQTMTEKSGVGSEGIAALAFTNSGAGLVFAWDVGTDLPGVEDSTVYVRLESNDSATDSNTAVSPAFTVDTSGPVISNIQTIQAPATDNVIITYDLADGAGINNIVALAVSSDSGTTYSVLAPNVIGDVGSGITAGLERSISWDAGIDLPNQEKTSMKVKVTATDSYGNEGSPLESGDFFADTKAPIISDVTATQVSGSALVTVTYNLSDLSSADVDFEVSADSGLTWDIAANTSSGDIGLAQTAGAKTFDWNAVVDFPDQELSTMRTRIRATDNFGHQGAYQESADFSLNTKVLSIANITAEQTVGEDTVIIHYDLNKTATITLDISADGGLFWNVGTTTLVGQIGAGITPGNNKTITWNPETDFNNEENPIMRVRLSGIDNTGISSPYYESMDFAVDTAAPLGLLSLSKFAGTDTSATMNWSPGVADAHFSHYELWHGSNKTDVINRNGTAVKWSAVNDADLNTITTISSVITGINLANDYFVKIWAIDDYGNEATITDLNVYSAPMAGNVGGSSGGFEPTVDSIPPVKPILSPLKSPTNIALVNISGLAEAGSQIDLYDNDILIQRLKAVTDSNGLFGQAFNFSEGSHVLTVKAVDSAANVSEESAPVNLEIKTTLPMAPIVLSPKNGDRIVEDTPILVGVADPLSQIEITLDILNKFIITADINGAWQFKLPTDFALKNGFHSFVLVAIDQAGNKSPETLLDLSKIELPAPVIAPTPAPTIVPAQELISIPLPPASLVLENTVAVELPGIPVPEVTSVTAASRNDFFTFTGKALPNQEVLVFIHSDQALIYRAKADVNGIWQINHSQTEVELTPGEHAIYTVAVDSSAKVKSQPSPVVMFTVEKSFWVSMFSILNLQTTIVTLIVILLAMFWLYRIKGRKTANV
jgi:hypothetical protein